MALLNVVFVFILIGVLLAAGAQMYGAIVDRGKINDTKAGLENQTRMVIAWAANNKRLPAPGSEFNSIFGPATTAPRDAWGNTVGYVLDSTMSVPPATSTGNNICGRTISSAYYSSPTNYVAFALVSGGGTSLHGTMWPGSFGLLTINQGDIARIVTLNELQARAGCSGVTLGYLRIVNNELPNACSGSTAYSGNLFGDGGVAPYTWSLTSSLSGLSIDSSSGKLSFASAPAANTYSVAITLTDSQSPTPTTVHRTYSLRVVDCNGPAPPGDALHNGANSGINTNNTADASAFSNNIVTGMSGIKAVGNLIEFGFNQGNGSACVWYPYNFPLLGKTLRTYWNFCFENSDTSTDSKANADGYTFTLMQGSNPTTYCGTGTPYDSVFNPYYDCSDKPVTDFSGAAHFGEFLAYCGLPGRSAALEFDIYPNTSANDPSGNYNHVAVVEAINKHNGYFSTNYPTAYFGDNTHNLGGNPACRSTLQTVNNACNGTCSGTCSNGTCNGATINGACIGTCNGTCSGTCNGTGSGCVYNGFNGSNSFNIPSGHTAVTWLEDGCNAAKDNHNARVEIHSRCNSDCSQCETSSCTTKSFIKAWIDKGNNNLGSNEPSTPDLSYCADLPTALNQFKVGFTQATGASKQMGYISNFILKSYGSCSLPVLSPLTVPAARSGTPYAAQVTASGGQPPYAWSLSASTITEIAASTLPPGLSTTLRTSGTCPGTSMPVCSNASPCICGTPTTAGTYNTVLISATDSCQADNCVNTTSQSYTINVCSALSISTGSTLTSASTGTAYLTNLSPSGGTGPYTWSLASGSALPNGLSLSSSGAISGTPTTPGTYSFSIVLGDSCGGSTVQKTFTITITSVTYTVTANVGTGGSITPASTVVSSGSRPSFTVTPSGGYNISSVSGCSGTLAGNTYTTGPITTNCTVSANFAPVCSTISVYNGINDGKNYDFVQPTGRCRSNLSYNNRITNKLSSGTTITRYDAQSNCSHPNGGYETLNFNDALIAAQSNGTCRVSYTPGRFQ